ncbi:permease-like cell division protein FtsX [Patescibacteria group bacterium]|nr:permease-like cell division protein FtsX [Patescibacteria group bacterium]
MPKVWNSLKHYLKKEKLMTVSHFLVMGITFLILGIFINVVVLSQTMLKYLEDQAQVTVFFKDEFGEDKINPFKDQLSSDERISEVTYVSKEEALRIFKEINEDQPVLLESISASVLPASLEIKTKDIADLESLSNELGQKEGVEEVRFYKDVVERFRSVSNTVYIVGAVLVVSFFIISYSVIISSLRTAINSRGSELEVMKLVGANDSYIKKPFIYQGVFFSVMSAVVASILMIILDFGLSKWDIFSKGLSIGFFPDFFISPVNFSLILSCILIVSGFLLGYFGSNAAVKKYLKY